eukprot:10742297-Karenia_brevis.AAC.1
MKIQNRKVQRTRKSAYLRQKLNALKASKANKVESKANEVAPISDTPMIRVRPPRRVSLTAAFNQAKDMSTHKDK